MVVECESCHTRFRLDEGRIPATGAKVRCSRCKTAFIVQRPSVSRDDVIDEVVAEATNPGAAAAPEHTEDLFETGGSFPLSAGATESERSSEEKWEFDEEPRTEEPGPRKPRKEPAAPEPSQEAEADDLDSLGSPEEWDFLGTGARRAADEARFEAPVSERQPERRESTERDASGFADARPVETAVATAASEPDAAEGEARSGWLRRLREAAQLGIDGGMWIAAILLCGVGLALAFMPRAEQSGAPRSAIPASIQGGSLDVVVARVESAVGGTLAVVRGQLPLASVPGEALRLRATFLDAKGMPIAGASAIAGPPASEQRLRELSLERLQAEYEAHALELRAGGAFEVAFASLPVGAMRISLTRERVPAPAPAVTQEGEPMAAATASSRPSARPSSE